KTKKKEQKNKKRTKKNEKKEIIKIKNMEEAKAKNKIDKNELSSYIIFPDEFITKLYEGISVEVEVVGNPQRTIESEMTKELIDSLMRHINTSQANILLLNKRAKELKMAQDE